jgi:DNA-binding Lrp family transcriptional regulator
MIVIFLTGGVSQVGVRGVEGPGDPRSRDARSGGPGYDVVPTHRGRFRMVSAYVLIQTEVGKASQVTKSVADIDGISAVDGVTGPYDVIARADASDLDELAKKIVMPIQEVDGVTRTLTCPVLQL